MTFGRKTGGRAKGTPNRLTAQVRDMILAALDQAGGQDYLVTQARENPTAFLALVGKLVPRDAPTGFDDRPVKIQVVTGVPRAPLDETIEEPSAS